MEREELALRCEELGRALEQRVRVRGQPARQDRARAARRGRAGAPVVPRAGRRFGRAVGAARRGARRSSSALSELYGASAHQAAAAELAAQWEHKFDRSERECARLRQELETERLEHGIRGACSGGEQRRPSTLRRLRAVRRGTGAAGAASVKAQLESQLVRLSEGFNKQVEEVLAVQKVLQATRDGLHRQQLTRRARARGW